VPHNSRWACIPTYFFITVVWPHVLSADIADTELVNRVGRPWPSAHRVHDTASRLAGLAFTTASNSYTPFNIFMQYH